MRLKLTSKFTLVVDSAEGVLIFAGDELGAELNHTKVLNFSAKDLKGKV